MEYKKLSSETWAKLSRPSSFHSGYESIWLTVNEKEESNLHIFIDESGFYHFAIEVLEKRLDNIEDPGVNGLEINLVQFLLKDRALKNFIDLRCSLPGYLNEYNEVIKEITHEILVNKRTAIEAINLTIKKWRIFWATKTKQTLSEEEQIGLICELIVLRQLIKINPLYALNAWDGPSGQKHDFNFSNWNIEIKGTRRGNHTHTINGIDQLKPSNNKNLAFVSFLVLNCDQNNSINLQEIIESILQNLQTKPDLFIKFNQLLSQTGYSPIHSEEYRKFKIEIIDALFYIVDSSFPSLTSDQLSTPLNHRISNIRYNISLEGLPGQPLKNISWGDYFF